MRIEACFCFIFLNCVVALSTEVWRDWHDVRVRFCFGDLVLLTKSRNRVLGRHGRAFFFFFFLLTLSDSCSVLCRTFREWSDDSSYSTSWQAEKNMELISLAILSAANSRASCNAYLWLAFVLSPQCGETDEFRSVAHPELKGLLGTGKSGWWRAAKASSLWDKLVRRRRARDWLVSFCCSEFHSVWPAPVQNI